MTDPASTREKIDAARRISFARFSSAFSRSSWRTRSLVSLVISSRSPVSITHLGYLSGARSFGVIGELACNRGHRGPLKKGTPLGVVHNDTKIPILYLEVSNASPHAIITPSCRRVGVSSKPGVIQVCSMVDDGVFEGPTDDPFALRLAISWDGTALTWSWHWAPAGERPVERSRATVRLDV